MGNEAINTSGAYVVARGDLIAAHGVRSLRARSDGHGSSDASLTRWNCAPYAQYGGGALTWGMTAADCPLTRPKYTQPRVCASHTESGMPLNEAIPAHSEGEFARFEFSARIMMLVTRVTTLSAWEASFARIEASFARIIVKSFFTLLLGLTAAIAMRRHRLSVMRIGKPAFTMTRHRLGVIRFRPSRTFWSTALALGWLQGAMGAPVNGALEDNNGLPMPPWIVGLLLLVTLVWAMVDGRSWEDDFHREFSELVDEANDNSELASEYAVGVPSQSTASGAPSTLAVPTTELPVSAQNAIRQAEAEGLTLVTSSKGATGYSGVIYKGQSYGAKRQRDGKRVQIGTFATAEEAALCLARSLRDEPELPSAQKPPRKKRSRVVQTPSGSDTEGPSSDVENAVGAIRDAVANDPGVTIQVGRVPLVVEESDVATGRATKVNGYKLKMSSRSATGYAGVKLVARGKKYQAYKGSGKQGVPEILGEFDDPVEAALEYAKAAPQGNEGADGRLTVGENSLGMSSIGDSDWGAALDAFDVTERAAGSTTEEANASAGTPTMVSPNGIFLHLSSTSATGYRGVSVRHGGRTEDSRGASRAGGRNFQAKRGSGAGGIIGTFSTAVEAAEAYALKAGAFPKPDGQPPSGYGAWDPSLGVWRNSAGEGMPGRIDAAHAPSIALSNSMAQNVVASTGAPPEPSGQQMPAATESILALSMNKASSTGYKGVYPSGSKSKPYLVRVRRGGKQVSLGVFETAKEAALCYAGSSEAQAVTAAAVAVHMEPQLAATTLGETGTTTTISTGEAQNPRRTPARRKEVIRCWKDAITRLAELKAKMPIAVTAVAVAAVQQSGMAAGGSEVVPPSETTHAAEEASMSASGPPAEVPSLGAAQDLLPQQMEPLLPAAPPSPPSSPPAPPDPAAWAQEKEGVTGSLQPPRSPSAPPDGPAAWAREKEGVAAQGVRPRRGRMDPRWLWIAVFFWMVSPGLCMDGSGGEADSDVLLRLLTAAGGLTPLIGALVSRHGRRAVSAALETSTRSSQEQISNLTPRGVAGQRGVVSPSAETRQVGRRTARSGAWAAMRDRQRAAAVAVPLRAWYVRSFCHQLRRLTRKARCRRQELADEQLRDALQRHPLCACFGARLRGLAMRRSEAKRVLAGAPRRVACDVGYDATTGVFTFRDERGIVSTEHPTARSGAAIPAYDVSGSVVAPLMPPADSSVVLCPEANGGWCYYDTAFGSTSWFAPQGSTALVTKPVSSVELPSTAPPQLPRGLGLGTLRGTDWMLLRSDAVGKILLTSRVTGAVREAPWISLLSTTGVVYFANLITHETRWLPPHLWMEGWCRRPSYGAGTPSYVEKTPSAGDRWSPCVLHSHGRRVDDRDLLPQELARRLVEGGAPYVLDGGEPQYAPDEHDTPATYPLASYMWRPARAFYVHPGSPGHRQRIDPQDPRWSSVQPLGQGRDGVHHEAGRWVRVVDAEAGDEIPVLAGYAGMCHRGVNDRNEGDDASDDDTASTVSVSGEVKGTEGESGSIDGYSPYRPGLMSCSLPRTDELIWRRATDIQRAWRIYTFSVSAMSHGDNNTDWERWAATVQKTLELISTGYNLVPVYRLRAAHADVT